MFSENLIIVPVAVAFAPIVSLTIDQHPIVIHDEPIEQVAQEAPYVDIENVPLRRLERVLRPGIFDDYIVYLQEHEYDISDTSDPTTYKEAITIPQSNFWMDTINDEMNSMSQNEV